jgi:hypothetical protein
MGEDDSSAAFEPSESDPLSRWQRFSASLIGVTLTAAGGASVFVSANQAGSVVLMASGSAFLLMAVNGVPILRARAKDYEITLARRRKEVLKIAEREAPSEARKKLDYLQNIDPVTASDPAIRAFYSLLYSQEVFTALLRVIGPSDAPFSPESRDGAADYAGHVDGRKIGVIAKGRSDQRTVIHMPRLQANLERIASTGAYDGLILISNNRIPKRMNVLTAKVESSTRVPTSFAWWAGPEQDEGLKSAIKDLAARIEG